MSQRQAGLAFRALLAVALVSAPGCTSQTRQAPGEQTTTEAPSMSQDEQHLRIDYVEFASTNIERTKAFYSKVFGWEFTDYGPDYSSFADGRLAGGFFSADAVSPGGPLVVIYSTDLEATLASVTGNGGQVVREIFDFPGGRRFHFRDPSGNELAVWSDR